MSWQLLLCVHRYGKELLNTQKINVSTEIRHCNRLGPVHACDKQLGAKSRSEITYPVHGDDLTHTELKCAKLILDLHSLLWCDTWQHDRPVYLIHHGVQRRVIVCVMGPNTENLHLYTRQSRKEGFQLVTTRFMNDNTFKQHFRGGSVVIIKL